MLDITNPWDFSVALAILGYIVANIYVVTRDECEMADAFLASFGGAMMLASVVGFIKMAEHVWFA